MVRLLPSENERGWEIMRDADKGLVTSVRRLVGQGRDVSEKQFDWLCAIYERTNT